MTTSSPGSGMRGTVAIRSESLCRHYRMGETLIRAVDGVSLQVPAGEFVALLGSSGSGKSSILNLIAGLDRPTSGSVIVQDRDLAKLSREDLAKYRLYVVGMVFQSFNLIASMTLAENVELPLRFAEVERGKRDSLAAEALERVGLKARMHHRPSELSGGEQQRAALARALINQPKILLADEPTGNLDSRTGTEIMNLVQSFNQDLGMTVVMVTHERALAERYAQRMIFLADGKLVDGSRTQLAGRPRVKIPDLTELALRNLRESILRNSLTTVGISVGVASLVAMLSLGIGLQQMASRRLMKSGLFDTVVVTSRRDARGMSREDERSGPAPGESRILDEAARSQVEKLPNVSEAYPDIRFATELRFEDKPHMSMISALPESARSNDAFEGMQGSFFSSDAAPEAILQKSFAEELLGKTPRLGAPEPNVAELAKPLLGKELTMVYAQRATSTDATAASSNPANEVMGASYSVVSREQKLKIVGVADLDPESMRGPTRAKVFLPLHLAESLQHDWMSECERVLRLRHAWGQWKQIGGGQTIFVHQRASEESFAGAGGRGCDQEDGLHDIFHS